jgi:hypothetical protein
MATVIEARRLEDLEQDAVARVEAEFARRAQGVKPWTTTEMVERVCRVHAHYEQRRQWLRRHEQEAA